MILELWYTAEVMQKRRLPCHSTCLDMHLPLRAPSPDSPCVIVSWAEACDSDTDGIFGQKKTLLLIGIQIYISVSNDKECVGNEANHHDQQSVDCQPQTGFAKNASTVPSTSYCFTIGLGLFIIVLLEESLMMRRVG